MQSYKNVSAIKNPHDLLYQIGDKVAKAIEQRERGVEIQHSWNGIGFSLCGQKMVAQLSDVVEIIPLPEFTRIYGASDWMIGVANVRGALITLIDLEKYCGASLASSGQSNRVIVIHDGYTKIGLVVSKIFGLRNFNVNEFVDHEVESDEVYYPYIDGQIKVSQPNGGVEEGWLRFDVRSFADLDYIESRSTY